LLGAGSSAIDAIDGDVLVGGLGAAGSWKACMDAGDGGRGVRLCMYARMVAIVSRTAFSC
jgi:hypothetical protein